MSYHWPSGVSHQCYETMGFTSVTAELHSAEKTAQPGWRPWVEDNERKRVTRLPGSVRARGLSLSPHLGNIGIKNGVITQKSARVLCPNKKGSLARWLDIKLTKIIGNVLFLIT